MDKVTRSRILKRGLSNRCPNCGEKSLFKSGLNMNKACPHCGLEFERGEGFFLGSMSINYGVTLTCCLTPILLLWVFGVIPGILAIVLSFIGALGFPLLFYRSSRSWWLMFYYLVLPHELPVNRDDKPTDS